MFGPHSHTVISGCSKEKSKNKSQHENNKTDTTKQEYNVLCVSNTEEDLNIIKLNKKRKEINL